MMFRAYILIAIYAQYAPDIGRRPARGSQLERTIHRAHFANNLSRQVPIIVLIALEYSGLTASAGSYVRAPKCAGRLIV